ncbi:MAG: sporulation transcriptional regulator SpoIIID [Ruminococcaceae bacterium]|nr:sporulation transcriptional regulator SpoIIID [Oscillospiraceae bacterium]
MFEGEERSVDLAKYIISEQCTVRDAAAHFGVSKSTVHKDVTQKLKRTNPVLHKKVKSVLDKNKAERHLRGGEATRIKYLSLHNK